MGYYLSGLGEGFSAEGSVTFGNEGWKSQGKVETKIDEPKETKVDTSCPKGYQKESDGICRQIQCGPGTWLGPHDRCCPFGMTFEPSFNRCVDICRDDRPRLPDGTCGCPADLVLIDDPTGLITGIVGSKCVKPCPPDRVMDPSGTCRCKPGLRQVKDSKTKTTKCVAMPTVDKSLFFGKKKPAAPVFTPRIARPGAATTQRSLAKEESNLGLYLGIGAGLLAIGSIAYVVSKRLVMRIQGLKVNKPWYQGVSQQRSIVDQLRARQDIADMIAAPPRDAVDMLRAPPKAITKTSPWTYVAIGAGVLTVAGVAVYLAKR